MKQRTKNNKFLKFKITFCFACRQWSETIRSEKFWSWARLRVDLSQHPEQRETLLKSKLISLVEEMVICRDTDKNITEALLGRIMDGVTLQLKRLTTWDSLINIEANLISSAILQLQECGIQGQLVLSNLQAQAILTKIATVPDSKLRQLVLDCSVDQVAPDIWGEAAVKLEILEARPTSLQLEAVLIRVAATQDSRLKRLEVRDPVILSHMDPEVVARALCKIEIIEEDLSGSLSPEQVSALISRIRETPDLTLSDLDLNDKDLSIVPPEVLIGAIQKLRKLDFTGVMTAEQKRAIYTMVKEEKEGRVEGIKMGCYQGMESLDGTMVAFYRRRLRREHWPANVQ